jgi:hypothetical protein
MEPEGSLPCSQNYTTSYNPAKDESSLHFLTLFPQYPF